VQAPKGCKGRMEISPGFFPPAVRSAGRRVDASATPPLGIVSFLLTPQVQRRKIRATFSADSWSRGRERKNRASIQMCARGESVQYLPGWTVQCHQSGVRRPRPLWLRAADSGGELCSNCSSPLRNVPPPISRACACVPARWAAIATQPLAWQTSLVAASDHQGRSSRFPPGTSRPRSAFRCTPESFTTEDTEKSHRVPRRISADARRS